MTAPGSDRPPTITTVVQAMSLLCLVGYAALALMRDVEPSKWVLIALASAGLGLRPETFAEIVRRQIGGK